ncbi:sulfurtransferase TusA family protein [bacterium]|nr:sulfurtransferase TusA family protein [bacterium]
MTTPITDHLPDGVTVTETLDCSGLLCPLPVYKAALVLGRLDDGDVLRLVTTDPGALEDIPAMTRQRGDTLLAFDKDDTTQVFFVRKGVAS